jgi:hypothetical protein
MMATRFKDFGGDGQVNTDPISFKLYDEEFHCYPSIQGKVLLKIVANSDSNDGAGLAATVESFFEAALLPESRERLEILLSDPKKVVSIETLGEITAWLVEQYSARPTEGPENSSSGR